MTPEEAGLGTEPWQAGKKHLGPKVQSRLEPLPAVGLQRHLVVDAPRRWSSTCDPRQGATCPTSRLPWAPVAPNASRPSSPLPSQ